MDYEVIQLIKTVGTKSGSRHYLGIGGFVLVIISIVFIPFAGILTIIPGIIGIVLIAISLNIINNASGSKVNIITAIVISTLGIIFTILCVFCFETGFNYPNRLRIRIESVLGKNTDKRLQQNIKDKWFNSDVDKIMIDLSDDSLTCKTGSTIKVSDSDFNKFLVSYDKLIQASISYHNSIKKGDLNVSVTYSKISAILARVMTKLAIASPSLTNNQRDKIDKINIKYKKEFDETEK